MPVRFLQQYPLLFRLVCSALGFALVATLLVSGLQVWMGYQKGLTDIHQTLDGLQVSQGDTLANSLWSFDRQAVDIQLQSMIQDPDLTAIVVQVPDWDWPWFGA